MSIYSEYPQVRERAKDSYEEEGRKAFRNGKSRWDNPYASKTEIDDMKEFAPWMPSWGSGKNENLPAYYWDTGWENEESDRIERSKFAGNWFNPVIPMSLA